MSAVHYDIVGRLETGMNGTLGLLFDKLGIDPGTYSHSPRNSHDAHKKLKVHYKAGTPEGKEIARTVHDIYKSDIYDFGYSLDTEPKGPPPSLNGPRDTASGAPANEAADWRRTRRLEA